MKRSILNSKIYLYMTEFFAGMSVMAVELGASRLLAPYFSSSQIVWTIIIGTIMIAMALGNIMGGKMEKVDTGLVKYEAGDRILTDDKVPVELLSMNAIDALIRDEVDYYKDIYNEKGLKGLLEEL